MARLSPEGNNPQLSFRFKVVFSELKDIGIYAKGIQLPTVDNSPITVEYGNTQMKVKGKTKWNDITLTCYAYEKKTIDQLWAYLNTLHQKVEDGTDFYPDEYKKDIIIQLLSPSDIPVGTWKLIGAFMGNINFGEFDYAAEEVVQPQMTISYDYAMFLSGNFSGINVPNFGG